MSNIYRSVIPYIAREFNNVGKQWENSTYLWENCPYKFLSCVWHHMVTEYVKKIDKRVQTVFVAFLFFKNSWKMGNIRINMVSISKSVKRKLQQMKEPYVTIYTKKYRVMKEWRLKQSVIFCTAKQHSILFALGYLKTY